MGLESSTHVSCKFIQILARKLEQKRLIGCLDVDKRIILKRILSENCKRARLGQWPVADSCGKEMEVKKKFRSYFSQSVSFIYIQNSCCHHFVVIQSINDYCNVLFKPVYSYTFRTIHKYPGLEIKWRQYFSIARGSHIGIINCKK